MAKTQTYPMEKVLAVREVLRKLPAKENEKSRAEVVEFLKTDLRKAVKQGHSLKEIQALLAEQGVNVPLSRMEAILGQPGKDSAQKKAGKPKPDCGGMAQGNVDVSAPTIPAQTHPSSPMMQQEKPRTEAPKEETGKPEMQKTTPARKAEQKNMPSYYTPDLPDSEL